MSLVLLLGPERPDFVEYFQSQGWQVICTEEPLPGNVDLNHVDFIVSYGYRHIIKADVLERFRNRAVNLHISYLPWNRGADPNLWSYLEDSPKGVSIHFIDEGLDTGEILVQKRIEGETDDTLKTSYERLNIEIRQLFFEHWPDICIGAIESRQQMTGGSYHRLSDKEPYRSVLNQEWDTPVAIIIGIANRGDEEQK